MIKPTNGRVVLFTPAPTDPIAFSDQPLAAHVAYVHSDRMVNLLVIDSNGGTHSRTSVTLIQDDDAIPEGTAYAEWMPYQKGQAAKAEALEAKLADAGKPVSTGKEPVDVRAFVEAGTPAIATSAGDVETHPHDAEAGGDPNVTETQAEAGVSDEPADGNA